MANPRELAQQAFALLQNALRASEARADDLDAQLKRKKAPKTKIEEQLDVLTHRLESVEAERAHWQREAGQLEEIAAEERAKVAQLKKRLQIAESGPEKLTKKEINFWRAKAEDIDTETKDYKARLAQLRKELLERDALIEQLRTGQGLPPPLAPTASDASAATEPWTGSDDGVAEALHARLEEREQELANLKTEIAALREREATTTYAPDVPFDAQVAIDGLKQQNARYDQALNEAHTARAALKAELTKVQTALAEAESKAEEAQANNAYVRTTLGEREQRIAQLSAELAEVRAEFSAAQADFGTTRDGFSNVRQELTDAKAELAQVRSSRAALEQASQEAQLHSERAQAVLEERDRRIVELSASLEQLKAEIERNTQADGQLRAELADAEAREREARAAIERHEQQVTSLARDLDEALSQAQQARGEADRVGPEIDELRAERDAAVQRAEQLDAEAQALRAASSQQAGDAETARQALESALAERDRDLGERDWRINALTTELEQARTTIETNDRELDQLRHQKHRLESEVSEALTRSDDAAAAASAKDEELARIAEELSRLQAERNDVSEQIAGLEAELKEEKDNAENLGELANERREQITTLQEQLEEANERYEEAKWHLGKAQHFERILNRRKGLIAALIAALRTKMKANTALKAGIDSLRTHKAAAEANQQKLLQRIDGLKAELEEAQESVARHHGATLTKDQLADTESRVHSLEERLNTQAELIQSLESDLKIARANHKSGDERGQEIERLQKELETKNEIIVKLQADTDEQQRKLAKLRGSESETLRLKAVTEKDKSSIDALEREVAQLREALSRQQQKSDGGGAADGSRAELEAKLKERDNSVTRLMGTVKEHEVTIKKLSESVESWKRKYDFLATEAPDAYKTAAEK